MPEKTVAFITLGCAKNEVDSQRMKARARRAGYQVIDDPEQANAIVINTCSFIQDATEESLDTIFEAAGYSNVTDGDAKIIVAGCMPARYGDELEQELVEVTAFIPCSKEDDIAVILANHIGLPSEEHAFEYEYEPTAGAFSTYVKISDGCDRFCSYCTIPYIRGRYHSFSYEEIRADVKEAVDAGVREIILIAQDTGRWGADFEEKSSLAWLMATLADEFADTWFRVMYIQPEGLTDELLNTIASKPNICNYLDIPLQHVNAEVLKRMNRTGCREEFDALIQKIRQVIPGVTLRTTLIAGFPGETDEQFDELCEFVEECDFDFIGVFPYSVEDGTRAAKLDGQLDEDEKKDRAQQVRDLADALCTAKCADRVGQTTQVLIEGMEEDGQLFGRAMFQAPEVDGGFYINEGELGQIVNASINDALFYELEGEAL